MNFRVCISATLLMLMVSTIYPCRMLGVIALPGQSLSQRDTNGNLHPFLVSELEEFRLQGGSGSWPYSNSDGWAMTSYAPDILQHLAWTVRSEVEAYSDADYFHHTTELLNRDDVSVLMGHLRQTSSGAGNIQNPHPFIYNTDGGHQYSFSHNGDLNKSLLRELIGDAWLENHPPQTYSDAPWDGDGWSEVVDSELFFFWIIKSIESSNSLREGMVSALQVLEEAAPNHIKNFLFSDGIDLYTYRSSPNADIYYFDADHEEELPWYMEISNQRAVMSTPPPDGPMSEIPWIELPNKELLILRADGSTEHIYPLNLLDTSQTEQLPRRPDIVNAYPNPFNAGTTLQGEVLVPDQLNLNIYDTHGRVVYHSYDYITTPGAYTFFWRGADQAGVNLPSGSYFFSIKGMSYSASGKILLLK